MWRGISSPRGHLRQECKHRRLVNSPPRIGSSRASSTEMRPNTGPISLHWRMASNAVVFWVVCWCLLTGVAVSASRLKREIRFPKGGSFVAAVALASALPKVPTDGFFHVLEFDLGFPFPEKIQIGKSQNEVKKTWKDCHGEIWRKNGSKVTNKHPKRCRRRRDLKENQREKLLLQIEDAVTRGGFNGSSCITRFRCELRQISPKGSLLEELLSALFTPSHDDDEECVNTGRHCPVSLLHALIHSEQISARSAEPTG